jgi:hypothetical protein
VELTVGPQPDSIALADFNGDGVLDVVTANSAINSPLPGSVSVAKGFGNGTFGLSEAA